MDDLEVEAERHFWYDPRYFHSVDPPGKSGLQVHPAISQYTIVVSMFVSVIYPI